MHMDAFLWMFLPVFVAGGSALLSFYIMQARMEVALAKERESLAEARATITSQKITMEERSYVRESKSLNALRRTMVMQERLFFRNIPLSNWIEHEMIVEEGRDLDELPKESVFSAPALAAEQRLPVSKFLDEVKWPGEVAPETASLVGARIPAFGAQ